MTKPGPIKHCPRCNHPMMVQVQVCQNCGRDMHNRYEGPHPAWLMLWGAATFGLMVFHPLAAIPAALIWGATIGNADAALRAMRGDRP